MAKAIMTEDNIVLNANFQDKWAAIRACGEILYQNGYVEKAYIDDMAAREKVATVYVGNHVAIPHGIANSEKSILASGISFIQIPEGVSFGDEKAYIMVGIAGKDGAHIEMLSKIALVCVEPENIELLRSATDKKAVLDLFSTI